MKLVKIIFGFGLLILLNGCLAKQPFNKIKRPNPKMILTNFIKNLLQKSYIQIIIFNNISLY